MYSGSSITGPASLNGTPTHTFIPDGYTFHEFLQGVPGAYADLHFDRRHMPIDEIEEWIDLTRSCATVAEKNSIWREMVIKAIPSWDLKHDGKPVPINQETLNKHIHRLLWDRLIGIVLGQQVADLPPKANKQQTDDHQRRLAALRGGENVAAAEEAADEKNSAAGSSLASSSPS